MLYDQVPKIHPYPYTRQTSKTQVLQVLDVSAGITSALDWHINTEETLKDTMLAMLRNGQYTRLLDTFALYRALETSYSKFLLASERSRVQRLTGASSQEAHKAELCNTPTISMKEALADLR